MDFDVIIYKVNEVYIEIRCEQYIAQELFYHFSFRPNGYQFNPKYKERIWDGWIRMYKISTKRMYAGLYNELIQYLQENNYTHKLVENEYYGRIDETNNIDYDSFVEYIKTLNLSSHGKKIDPRDYQLLAAYTAIKEKRLVVVSPTSSGKSLVIYMIVRYLMDHNICSKFLLIFPSTGLIQQMVNDFVDYSSQNDFDVSKMVHMIYSGKDKKSICPIHFSTWQSIYKLPSSWYDGYDATMVDECHLAQSDSFTKIFENCRDIAHRIGFTGTLSNKNKVHRMVVQGLLGRAQEFTSTAELIERKETSDIDISCVILQYSNDTRKANRKMLYAEEIDFICKHERRNKFIVKLALDSVNDGNTIILFQKISQGKLLYQSIKEQFDSVYYIDGQVSPEIRENIRQKLEEESNAIVVASYGTTSTGWSVRNLHHGIFASPYKSEVKVLQSIGRGLRKHHNKNKFKLYDIVDDMTYKSRENFCVIHLSERISYYAKQSLNYKIFKVSIE